MPVSRSAAAFQERHGRRFTRRHPVPRLSTGRLRVHFIPLERPLPNPHFQLDAAGAPAPDRSGIDVWPPSQEVG